MHKKLQVEARKIVLPSGSEKKTLEYHSMPSCSVYPRDAENVLRGQISETFDNEFIHSSHESQNITRAMNTEFGTKAYSAVERFIECSKYM